jgi:TonB family protein
MQSLTVAMRSAQTFSFPTAALIFLGAVWLSTYPTFAQDSPSQAQPSTWQEWTSLAVQKIDRARRFPSESAIRHEAGTVKVEFVVYSDGFIITSRVVEPSCYDELNSEALEILRRASPLPPFPAGATEKRRRLVQNIIFEPKFKPKDAPPDSPKPRTRAACQTS